jgi:hypothetical protein
MPNDILRGIIAMTDDAAVMGRRRPLAVKHCRLQASIHL